MKQQVFYIHGASSYSNYEDYLHDLRTMPVRNLPNSEKVIRWTQHLEEDLGERFEVFMPSMPNKQNAKYEEWKIWFERHVEYLHDDIILIGWSQGGYFFVKYLLENTLPVRIKALCLLGTPFESDDFGGEDGGDFAFDTTRVASLANMAKEIHLFHSKDDFVVPYEHALKYKAALPLATLHTYADKNHFLIEEFPELLELVRDIAK